VTDAGSSDLKESMNFGYPRLNGTNATCAPVSDSASPLTCERMTPVEDDAASTSWSY